MKTIITKITVFCFLFLLNSFAKAQNNEDYAYYGGVADGYASETLQINNCDTPYHHYAYFGGNADGAATDTKEDKACDTPYHHFAYFGGEADGATRDSKEDNVCDTPYHFYAYFGGDADGASRDATPNICSINPPVASFTASDVEICVGGSITFTDTSTNQPSAWEWTFAGGTPSTSIAKNPVVQYNTPGTYTVTLKVTNFNGTDTITKTGYIIVYEIPTVSSSTPGSICEVGQVSLSATASVGTINWYDAPTGGNLLGSGTSFTTPSISTTTSYYAEAVNGTCTSLVRTKVTATVNHTAAPTGNTSQELCGNKTLADIIVNGSNIKWYDASTGGNLLPDSTPIVYGTTYYATQTISGCESPSRLAVTVTNGTCLGVNNTGKSGIKVYPIPVVEDLYLETDGRKILSVEIYTASGQKIMMKKTQNDKDKLDFRPYPSGIYLVRIIMENEIKTVKVIKK